MSLETIHLALSALGGATTAIVPVLLLGCRVRAWFRALLDEIHGSSRKAEEVAVAVHALTDTLRDVDERVARIERDLP